MTNKDYVLSIAKQREAKAFIVRDGRGEIVQLSDQPASLNGRFEELKNFLENNVGAYDVELRTRAGAGLYPTAKQRNGLIIGVYPVVLDSPKLRGVGGIDVHGAGGSSHTLVREYEKEIRELERKVSQLENQIVLKDLKLENLKSEHSRELSEAKSADKRIQGYMQQFSSVLMPTPGNRPIRGTGDVSSPGESPGGAPKNDKEKIVNAINRLVDLDHDFANSITKLADLAEQDPEKYSMAKAML